MAIIFNGREVKLGRNPGIIDPRRVMLLSEHTQDLPPPPVTVDYTHGQKPWGMMKNDTLGDCTAAGVGHAFQVWTKNACTHEWTPTDKQVVEFYSKTTGYNPRLPWTDRGGDEPTVLDWLQRHGYFGWTIDAWGTMKNIHDHTKVKQLIDAFGGLYIGFQVPKGIPEEPGSVWDMPAGLEIEGGHCVFVPGYLPNGNYIVITWGEVVYMTPAFWDAYNEEAHAILAGAWFKDGKSPTGLDRAALRAAAAAL
jgi:hypothetical protein